LKEAKHVSAAIVNLILKKRKMENFSSSRDKDHDNIHPKPTEDAGAQIETVTPDTEKEGTPNDRKVIPPSTEDASQADQKDSPEDIQEKDKSDASGTEDADSENTEPGQDKNEGDVPPIETVAP